MADPVLAQFAVKDGLPAIVMFDNANALAAVILLAAADLSGEVVWRPVNVNVELVRTPVVPSK